MPLEREKQNIGEYNCQYTEDCAEVQGAIRENYANEGGEGSDVG